MIKRQRVTKTPAFLFAAIWEDLAHFLPGLKYLEIDKDIIITFPLQGGLAFIKYLFFVFVSFVLVAICILLSLLGNRKIIKTKKNIFLCLFFIRLDCDIHLRKLKKL